MLDDKDDDDYDGDDQNDGSDDEFEGGKSEAEGQLKVSHSLRIRQNGAHDDNAE